MKGQRKQKNITKIIVQKANLGGGLSTARSGVRPQWRQQYAKNSYGASTSRPASQQTGISAFSSIENAKYISTQVVMP